LLGGVPGKRFSCQFHKMKVVAEKGVKTSEHKLEVLKKGGKKTGLGGKKKKKEQEGQLHDVSDL